MALMRTIGCVYAILTCFFPSKFKCAAVTPLLKKQSLDPDNPSSYRPISNLNTISKILERLFLSRLYPHVTSSSNFNHLQSAYRPFHSTETALLQIFDNKFHSADLSQPTLLVYLDLSAAFDTIDHAALLSRLSTSFGMHGTALAWLTSYLTNRSQTVLMGSVSSNPSNCTSGVPQDSVLGPILFSLYISPLGKLFLILAWLISSMLMTPNFTSISRGIMSLTPFCTRQRLSTFPVISSIEISGNDIKLSDQITSLDVIMDSTLTFDANVTALCKARHFHLRSLGHIMAFTLN